MEPPRGLLLLPVRDVFGQVPVHQLHGASNVLCLSHRLAKGDPVVLAFLFVLRRNPPQNSLANGQVHDAFPVIAERMFLTESSVSSKC